MDYTVQIERKGEEGTKKRLNCWQVFRPGPKERKIGRN